MTRSILLAVIFSVSAGIAVSAEQSTDADPYTPYPFAQITDDIRYTAAAPPAGTVSRHGEIEYLANNVFGTHWFVQADAAVWHFVTAGDPDAEVILFVHGHPDTWWSWHEVMAYLADDFYVIALDTLGYGQSDKRLDLDLTYPGVATGIGALMAQIGVERFNLVGHDRGAVLGDHMVAQDDINPRHLAYLRMQQSANKPHGLPRPRHEEMAQVAFHTNDNVITASSTARIFLSICRKAIVTARIGITSFPAQPKPRLGCFRKPVLTRKWISDWQRCSRV